MAFRIQKSTSARSTRNYRWIELVRGVWGAALLASPDRVLGFVHGLEVDTTARVVARILGARHLTQSGLSGLRPSPEVLAMGAWVDAVHAITALGLATFDRRRARAGLTDTAIAAVWAAAGYRDISKITTEQPRRQRIRERLATAVLRHAPGGKHLLEETNDTGRSRRATS